jgi:hypothetical protein
MLAMPHHARQIIHARWSAQVLQSSWSVEYDHFAQPWSK